MAAASAPTPPDGYAEPYAVGYPTVILLIGSIILGILSLTVYGWLLLRFQGPEVAATIGGIELVDEDGVIVGDIATIGLPLFSAVVITVTVHEFLHGITFERMGYTVRYGLLWSQGAFYTAAIEQFQERDDLVVVALAPFVGITLLTVPMLLVSNPMVALTAVLVLFMNTVGSVADLYLVWRLWRLPPGTLLYDIDLERMYAYEPVTA